MKQSTFHFTMIDGSWNILLQYAKNKGQMSFDKDSILELRDRSLLMQHTVGYGSKDTHDQLTVDEEQKSKEDQELLGKYVHFSNSVRQILENLDSLYQFGYPDVEDNSKLTFQCLNSDYKELREFENEVRENLNRWQEDLVRAYSQSYWLTFVDGRNFWLVQGYLEGKVMSPKDE